MEPDRNEVQAVPPTQVKTPFRYFPRCPSPRAFYADGNVSVETCKSLSEKMCHEPSNGEEDRICELCEEGSWQCLSGPG